jgi:hypothetical protein
LLVAHCEHGICQGFMLLRKHESPLNVLQFYYERLEEGQSLLDVVLSLCAVPARTTYDMACKLDTSFAVQEPWFSRNALFLVDTLHFANHKACSEGYDTERLQHMLGVRQHHGINM